jgi:hypothetical protein
VALHGFASGTPVTDGEAVYAFFGSSGVVAYDLEGNQLWTADVGDNTHGFGTGASPVLHGDLVIVNASVESGSLVALDRKTGNEVWRLGDVRRAWNTPVLVEVEGAGPELVLNSAGIVIGVDPKSGVKLWSFDSGVSDYICTSVVASKGIVYAVCGRRGTVVAVRAGGRGDVTDSHEVWVSEGSSNVPSPVLHDGHLYWVSDKGIAYCLDASTGEEVYKKRLPDTGRVYASAVAAEGRLYVLTRENGGIVLAAKPEFAELVRNGLGDASIFNASPAVSNGQLLLRSDKFLYCIGK